MIRKLVVLFFGGCFEVFHVSTNDTWMVWRRKRDGWWPAKVDAWLNPESRPGVFK
jgi:predicted Rdx family selenoprotein